jgi:hypothetical protein
MRLRKLLIYNKAFWDLDEHLVELGHLLAQ